MKKILLSTIKIYQKYLSMGTNCRFQPTCSKYTYKAISKYGTIKGLILGVKRLLRCHPFSIGGFDPVK